MNPTRSGALTSEFLTTLVGQLIGFLVLSGKVQVTDANSVTQAIVAVIGGLISIYTAVAYIWSRTSIKKTVMEQGKNTPVAAQNVPTPPTEVTNTTVTQ